MSKTATNKEFLTAMSFLSGCSAWGPLKEGLEAQIKASFEQTFTTTDERALQRIIGGCQILTKFIEEVDSATGQIAANANGGKAQGIQLDPQ